jgi:ribosomal subunit interface protein
VPRHARKSAWAEVRLKESGAKDKNQCTCEAVLHVPEETITVSETTFNMYAAVDITEEKLKHRLRKYKELHQQSKLRHRLLARFGRKPAEVEAD